MRFWIIIISLIVLAFAGLSAYATDSDKVEQMENCLREAESAFQQGNSLIQTDSGKAMELYNRSILNFQKLIDDYDIRNKHIYYNIGNAWLMQGNVAKAIVNYRRAEALDGGSADIAGNLNYARSLRTDRIPVPVEKKVMETLFFWHYDFAIKSRMYIALTGWWVSCLLIAVILLSKRINKPFIAVIVFFLLCTAALASSVALESLADTHYGVIIADSTVARQGDGDNYPASYTEPLHNGTEFILLQERQNWLKVELGNGDITWIKRNDAELI